MIRPPSFGSGLVTFDWRPPPIIGGGVSHDVGVNGLAQSGVVGTPVSAISPLGRYSPIVGSFASARFYFPAASRAYIFEGRDFHIAMLANWTASGSRGFAFSHAASNGASLVATVGVNTSNNWTAQVQLSDSSTLNFTGAARDTASMQRTDIVRRGNRFGFAVDGVWAAAQTSALEVITHTAAQWAVGGTGEYTGGGNGGAYGDRWIGVIERLVILQGTALFDPGAPFDPYDPRPFRSV